MYISPIFNIASFDAACSPVTPYSKKLELGFDSDAVGSIRTWSHYGVLPITFIPNNQTN